MRPRRRRPRLGFLALLALLLLGLIYGGWRLLTRRKDTPARLQAATRSLRGVTVVLDPGHGGTDSGARDAGLREDELNYRLTSTVAAVLRGRGATVVFTVASDALIDGLREGQSEPPLVTPADATLLFNGDPVRLRADKDPADLYRRAAFAARIWRGLPRAQRTSGRAIYFLALHCDKLPTATGRGARVYFDSRNANGPSRLAIILRRRLSDAGLTNSPNGTPIPRHYGVLNPLYNPIPESVLLEMLTMSNPLDRRAAIDSAWRWRLAHVVANAIAECEAGNAAGSAVP